MQVHFSSRECFKITEPFFKLILQAELTNNPNFFPFFHSIPHKCTNLSFRQTCNNYRQFIQPISHVTFDLNNRHLVRFSSYSMIRQFRNFGQFSSSLLHKLCFIVYSNNNLWYFLTTPINLTCLCGFVRT